MKEKNSDLSINNYTEMDKSISNELNVNVFNLKKKSGIKRFLTFLLIPSWRDPKISKKEYEIGKFKSKRKFFQKILNPLTIFGLLIILSVAFMGIFAPWITQYTKSSVSIEFSLGSFEPPSNEHIFGTTKNGWDIWTRLVWGCRSALTTGLYAIAISLTIGILLGVISAYFGGIIDNLINRFIDLLMAFPNFIITVIVIGILGQKIEYIMITLGVLGFSSYARFIRGSVLQVKQNLYINAAKTAGAKSFKVMFKHILPNAISPLIVNVSFDIGGVILGLAGLSYLGYGDPTIIDWGSDINLAQTKMFVAPWVAIFPGIFIALTVLGFMLLGDGLRDAIDPRLNK